ncbi:MAG: hypothetical protein HQL22_11550 [Candidatus Omnitrophica bacterium]|nr:hypothetical protein [Candidatus Omnitrophota bacterium]
MEKNQYELCIEVLKRLDRAGVLKDIMLIGSWCLPFYREYFAGTAYSPTIRTRDLDFLVPDPMKVRVKVDIPLLLKDLGFIVSYSGSKGYIKLEHADLFIEFLSPEKGQGIDEPVKIPRLGVNAVALRYLNFLVDSTIKVSVEGFTVCLPHPINFALHKLIIFQRRTKKDKAEKDQGSAVMLLRALINKGDGRLIKVVFDSIPSRWQKSVLNGLQNAEDRDILHVLVA